MLPYLRKIHAFLINETQVKKKSDFSYNTRASCNVFRDTKDSAKYVIIPLFLSQNIVIGEMSSNLQTALTVILPFYIRRGGNVLKKARHEVNTKSFS